MSTTESKNLLTEYIDFSLRTTDAPYIFHEFTGLLIIATLLGDRVYLMEGGSRIYPNFWLTLLAPSSWFRKSTALETGIKLLDRINPDLLWANSFSYEGLRKEIAEKITGLLYYDEFASLHELLQRDFAKETLPLLTSLYNGYMWNKRRLSNSSVDLPTHPVGNLGATSTYAWFFANIKQKDLEGGFYPRFMLIPANKRERTYPIRPRLPETEWQDMVNRLKPLCDTQAIFDYSPEAEQTYKEWYIKFESKWGKEYHSAFFTRMTTYCKKFAILNEIVNNQGITYTKGGLGYLSKKSIDDAGGRVNWLAENFKKFIDKELELHPTRKLGERIISALQEAPNHKLRRSAFINKLRISARQLEEALKHLLYGNAIRLEPHAGKGGGVFIILQPDSENKDLL